MEIIGTKSNVHFCSLAGRIDTNLCEEVDFENLMDIQHLYALYPDLADNQQRGRQGQSYESKLFGWKTD